MTSITATLGAAESWIAMPTIEARTSSIDGIPDHFVLRLLPITALTSRRARSSSQGTAPRWLAQITLLFLDRSPALSEVLAQREGWIGYAFGQVLIEL